MSIQRTTAAAATASSLGLTLRARRAFGATSLPPAAARATIDEDVPGCSESALAASAAAAAAACAAFCACFHSFMRTYRYTQVVRVSDLHVVQSHLKRISC